MGPLHPYGGRMGTQSRCTGAWPAGLLLVVLAVVAAWQEPRLLRLQMALAVLLRSVAVWGWPWHSQTVALRRAARSAAAA